MDWEAQDDGFVAKILVEEGSKDISVGQPVLVIVEEKVNQVHLFTVDSSGMINPRGLPHLL